MDEDSKTLACDLPCSPGTFPGRVCPPWKERGRKWPRRSTVSSMSLSGRLPHP